MITEQKKKLYLAWNCLSQAMEILNDALNCPEDKTLPDDEELADAAIYAHDDLETLLGHLIKDAGLELEEDPYRLIPVQP